MKKFLEKLVIPLVIGLLLFACSPTSSSSVSNSPSGGNAPNNSQMPVNIDGQSSVSGGGELNLQLTSSPDIPPADVIETSSTPIVPPADVLKQVNIPAIGDPGDSPTSDLITFIDNNNLMAIDLPGNWAHEHGSLDPYYYDTFTSPAADAIIENLVYNDDTLFDSSRSRELALTFLNTFYSSTGENGDITITDDAVQPDGSDRLTWKSIGGDYSGISFFEIREDDKKTFLMFTAWWNNDVDQDTLDVINNAISSYRVP